MFHAQAVDILNAMDTKERKKILKFFGSSTAEMCMQSTNAYRNLADSDLYFNTLRHQDQDISSQTDELLESSSDDELPEETRSCTFACEMEEELLANNLDQGYSTEYAIEQVAQDTSNISRRTQLAGQVGYSLSPQDRIISKVSF